MIVSFKHINTQQTLNTVKFSADSTNSTYFLHSSPSTQIQGVPDINYEDVCFINLTGQIYTHGKLYLDNYTDGYLDYLHKLCIENNKNAIILSGGEKYENGIRKAFVYINNVGIKSIQTIYSESFTINTDYKIILYTVTGAYWFKSSTYNLNDNEELICDLSDLARLSDLEVPIATEYQNGLMGLSDKEKLNMLDKGVYKTGNDYNGSLIIMPYLSFYDSPYSEEETENLFKWWLDKVKERIAGLSIGNYDLMVKGVLTISARVYIDGAIYPDMYNYCSFYAKETIMSNTSSFNIHYFGYRNGLWYYFVKTM